MGYRHVDPVLRGEIKVVVPKGSRVSRANVLLVLAYLANRADPKTGQAFPSVRLMADELGMPRSTVQTALGVLEAQGLISAVGGRSVGGIGRTTRWQLPDPPNGPTDRADNGPTGRALNGPTQAPNGPTQASERPDGSGTKQKEAEAEAEGPAPAVDIANLLDPWTRRQEDLHREAWEIERQLAEHHGQTIVDQAIADAHRRGLKVHWPRSELRPDLEATITRLLAAGAGDRQDQEERARRERTARRAACTTCHGDGFLIDENGVVTGRCPDCDAEAVA